MKIFKNNFDVDRFKFIILFLFIFLNSIKVFSADFKVIAHVNENVVTNYDMDNYTKIVKLYMKNTQIAERQMKGEILESYIDVLVRADAVKRENIAFDEVGFNVFRDEMESNADFLRRKKQLGVNPEFYENFLKNEFMWSKLVDEKIKPSVTVNSAEINESLEYLSKDSIRVRYNISEITLYRTTNSNPQQIVEKLYSEINEKNNFESLAEKFSQSANKGNKGAMGWVDESDINEKIAAAIRGLVVGKTSRPIYFGDDSSGYYMLVKLNDKKTEKVMKQNDLGRIQYFIYNKKLNIEIKNYIDRLYGNSFVEIY